MKILFPLVLALCLARVWGQESKSTTKKSQDSKVETTSASPVFKRLTVTPVPGIEYVSVSTEGLPDVSPTQELAYSTTAAPALKISDLLSGAGGQSYPAAIANNLYSPLPLYQPKYPGYQVSPSVPSPLAYNEQINSVPQQNLIPGQKFLPQQGPTPQPFYYQQPIFSPQFLNFVPQLPTPQPNYGQQPQLYQLSQGPQPQINIPQPPNYQPQFRQPPFPQQLFLQQVPPGLPQQQFGPYPQFIQGPQFYQQAVPPFPYFNPNRQPNYQPLALQIFGRGQHQGFPQIILHYNPSPQAQVQPTQQVTSPQPPLRVYQQQPQPGKVYQPQTQTTPQPPIKYYQQQPYPGQVFQPQAQPTPQPYQIFQYQPSQQLPQQLIYAQQPLSATPQPQPPIYYQQPVSATPQPQTYQVQSQPGIVYAQPEEGSTLPPVEPSRVDPENVTDKPLKVSLQVLNPEENKNQGAYSYASFSQSLPRGFAKTESPIAPTASALAVNQIQTALKVQSTLEPSLAQNQESELYNQSPAPNQGSQSQEYSNQNTQNPGYPSQSAQTLEYPNQNTQNQGYSSQSTQNQGYPNQNTQNPGYPSQSTQNLEYPNQNTQNQGYSSQSTQNQGYPNQNTQNQGYPNQNTQNQGYPNQGTNNQGYPNQGYNNNGYSQNQGSENRAYQNQRYQNNAQSLSQRQAQQQQFNGYPRVQFFGGLAPKLFSHYSTQ